jgi:hypothetical protein
MHMQGHCPEDPPRKLDPPRQSRTQCVLTVREDFLEAPTKHSEVWISGLYVVLAGVPKEHSGLLGVHGADVYVTDVAFVGDRLKARAIDVHENCRLYVAGALTAAAARMHCMHARPCRPARTR